MPDREYKAMIIRILTGLEKRVEDISETLNTEIEKNKATAKDLSKRDVSNMADGEFKAIIIRILTGLEKRVEDISETLNKEIQNIKKK